MVYYSAYPPPTPPPVRQPSRLRSLAAGLGIAFCCYTGLSFALPYLFRVPLELLWDFAMHFELPYELLALAENIFILIIYILTLVPFAVLGGFWQLPLSPLFSKTSQTPGQVAGLLAIVLGGSGVGNLLSALLSTVTSLFGYMPYYQPPQFGGGVAADIVLFLTITVGAGILEELAFRGVVLQLLRPYGDGFAVLVSAGLFALAHPSLSQLPATFVTGLALGYVAVSTGSLRICIFGHMLYNALVMLITELQFWLPSPLDFASNWFFTVLLLLAGLWGVMRLLSAGHPLATLPPEAPPEQQPIRRIFTSAWFISGLALLALQMLNSLVPY